MANLKLLRRRQFLHLAAGAAALPAVSVRAWAQTYPSRPITMIFPFAPGGNTEVGIRFLVERLSSSLGHPIVLENHEGRGGSVGAKIVSSAAADGHTLLVTTPGPLVVVPTVVHNLDYDPVRSFTPVATVMTTPHMLVVPPTLAANTMQELVAQAKIDAGRLKYVSPGRGTAPQLLGEMFKRASGVDIVHDPYPGPAPALAAIFSGRAQIYFYNVASALPSIRAGKLKPIAVLAAARSPQLPDVPTMIESGFPKLRATFWTGIFAPGGTPVNIASALNTAINDILKSADMQANLANLGAEAKIGSPQDFNAFLSAERQQWAEIVLSAGIKAE